MVESAGGRRGRRKSDGPSPVDVHVGGRVRLRRVHLGMSQERLGLALGLTFQQVQKYERGANRISASRLYDLSQVLSVPVEYFFAELAGSRGHQAGLAPVGMSEGSAADYESDGMGQRERMELAKAYGRVTDRQVRRRLVELMKAIANFGEKGASV